MESAGWYGKLPALGDFAGRRLTPLFVEPWDRWLAAGLDAWQQRDPAWLDAFLAAPIWRFALGNGVPFDGSRGWAGVLMPSVDHVGRYFPLTVARARGSFEDAVATPWSRSLESLAVAALDEDWDAERLDTELDRLAALDEGLEDDGSGPPWPEDGETAWWCERDGETSVPLVVRGLPDAETLSRMLGERPPPEPFQ